MQEAVLTRYADVPQQDGTVEQILERRPQLEQILSQLCGVGVAKEADDTVRAALAEAILMLVGQVLVPAAAPVSIVQTSFTNSVSSAADMII